MKLNRSVAAIVLASFLAQAPIGAFASDSSSKTQQSEVNKTGRIIKKAITQLGAQKDSGVPVETAFRNFAMNLHKNEVSVDDLKGYVLAESSPAAYEKFEKALSQLSPEAIAELTPEQYGDVLASTLRGVEMKFGASGLTWTGCGGDVALTAILVVGAVILAVVAYNKARGEDEIRSDYNDQRADRQSRYNSDVADRQTRKDQIQNSIIGLTGDNASDAAAIAKAQGTQSAYVDALVAIPDTEENKSARQSLLDKIKEQNNIISSAQSRIASRTTTISQLTVDLAYWSNPANVSREIANLQTQFTNDMSALDRGENDRVKLVDEYQAQAPYFWAGAGVAAGGGIFFLVGAINDCK